MGAMFGSAPDLAEFAAGSFVPKVLFENERMKVVLASFEAGQRIDLHAPDVDLAIAVLSGTGDVWVDDAPHPVVPGDVAVIPAGVTRGVRARGGRLVLLHVVSPPPTAADHAVERRPWPEEAPGPDLRTSLHREHQALLPHLDHIRALAERAEDLEEERLRAGIDGVLGFLRDELLPHATVEEDALYPAVDRLLRAEGGGTWTMSIDHRDIADRVERLGALARAPLTPEARAAVRSNLDGLEAVVRLHFRKEEEGYLPLLGLLSAAEAGDVVAALTAAAPGHHHAH